MGNYLKYFLVGLLTFMLCSCEDQYKNGYEIAKYAVGEDTVLIKTPKDAVINYVPSYKIGEKRVLFKAPGSLHGAKITVYSLNDSSQETYMGLEGSKMVYKLKVVETGK